MRALHAVQAILASVQTDVRVS